MVKTSVFNSNGGCDACQMCSRRNTCGIIAGQGKVSNHSEQQPVKPVIQLQDLRKIKPAGLGLANNK